MKLEKGDKIEVKGSRVTFSGKPAMIAAELKKGVFLFSGIAMESLRGQGGEGNVR